MYICVCVYIYMYIYMYIYIYNGGSPCHAILFTLPPHTLISRAVTVCFLVNARCQQQPHFILLG